MLARILLFFSLVYSHFHSHFPFSSHSLSSLFHPSGRYGYGFATFQIAVEIVSTLEKPGATVEPLSPPLSPSLSVSDGERRRNHIVDKQQELIIKRRSTPEGDVGGAAGHLESVDSSFVDFKDSLDIDEFISL